MAIHPLWSVMSPVRAHTILTDTQRGNKKLYRSVVESLSPGIGRRVPVVMEMPKLERHAAFAQLLSRPVAEDLGFNIISQWLVQEHAPMLCDWLDSLGIDHDEKGCSNTFPACPAGDKLRVAVDALLAKHDPDLVIIYLTAFNDIDEVQWEPLQKLLAEDKKLQLEPAEGSPSALVAASMAEEAETENEAETPKSEAAPAEPVKKKA